MQQFALFFGIAQAPRYYSLFLQPRGNPYRPANTRGSLDDVQDVRCHALLFQESLAGCRHDIDVRDVGGRLEGFGHVLRQLCRCPGCCQEGGGRSWQGCGRDVVDKDGRVVEIPRILRTKSEDALAKQKKSIEVPELTRSCVGLRQE